MVKKRTCQSNLTGHKNNPKKLVDAIVPLHSRGFIFYCDTKKDPADRPGPQDLM